MDPQKKKSKTDLPYGLAVLRPGTCPNVKAGTQRDARTPVFSAAAFTTARGVKGPGLHRQAREQTKHVRSTCEIDSAIRGVGVLSLTTARINPKTLRYMQ